jgi:hypothetical protein
MKKLSMTKSDRMAPGHAYIPELGSGIEWKPGTVSLWELSQVTETAQHQTASAFEYFHSLEFAKSFPDVTHWWFRSAWTQRVRLSGAQGTMDADTAWGYMQFIDQSVPAQMWTASVVDGDMTEIGVPYPPNEVQSVNLPLRLALARLVAGVLADEVARNEWLVITSLVQRDELELTFPLVKSGGWRLENVYGSLRRELCQVQGINEDRV